MHGLIGLAGILALVTLAYGEGAAVILARVLIIGAVILFAVAVLGVATGSFKGL
jgi:hypothetical protein